MSSTPGTIVSCPYCQRQYTMKMDRTEIIRRQARATCGRCGKSFELASRIVVPGAARHAPPPRSLPVQHSTRPAAAAIPQPELDTLMREIVAAADSWSPPSAARPDPTLVSALPEAMPPGTSRADDTTVVRPADGSAPSEVVRRAADDDEEGEPTAQVERLVAATPAFDADEITAPVPRLTAEDLRAETPQQTEATVAVPVAAMQATIETTPLSWIELADPGLAQLIDPGPPSPLERLINRA